MEAIELLKKYKKEVDPVLAAYFKNKIKKSGQIDPLARQAVEIIADFTLTGGKRIRPALVYYGYLACGGKNKAAIIEASMGIELIHSFLLIHDDIIDRDAMRHGGRTVHESYKTIYKSFFPKGDSGHFGNSMAIIAGDIASSMGNEIIFNAKFSPEIIIKALDKLQDIIYVTIPGEMLDVVMEARGKSTEKEILRMYEGKTSRYTFEGPLHLGCILAGGNEKTLKQFTAYSMPLGKAFQLRDDILGIYGEEKKLGKPVGSDIIEGKQTLLVIKAIEKGDKKQVTEIKRLLGKKDLTKEELDIFRKLIRETGSLEYSQKLSQKFVDESIHALRDVKFENEEARFFLEGIANYIIKREV